MKILVKAFYVDDFARKNENLQKKKEKKDSERTRKPRIKSPLRALRGF